MRKIFGFILLLFMRCALWFRYKVTVKGLEHLNPKVLNKPGGVLFLPNHSSIFVDPTLVAMAAWMRYPVRPMVVEYMYQTPIIHTIMRFMRALPVPNFSSSSNSLKKKKADHVIEELIQNLKKGDNFLLYPAGKTKHQAKEIIGASGTQRIIQGAPEANIVLVRTTGLWGSKFSRALTAGRSPPFMFHTIFWGIKTCLKNLLFFTPRRHVTIEFTPAGQDFPFHGSRLEVNRYLEKWYNRPDGLSNQSGEEPGESLVLVSYSMWKTVLPEVQLKETNEEGVDLANIPHAIQERVKQKLSEMAQMPVDQITPDLDLSADLGLDSLDTAELIIFLDDEYDVSGVELSELTSVGKMMAIAAKQIAYTEEVEEEQKDLSKWEKSRSHVIASTAPGNTIPEVFLNRCSMMGKQVACGDEMAGVLTYKDAKLRVLLLAEYIRTLPGDHVGVLLPSSVAAYLTILACQLAGKIPLLINWTMGPRHLESILALSHVKVILSSWAFVDKLKNVDFGMAGDLIVMLEDVRRQFTVADKLKALYRSKLGTKKLLSIFDVDGKQGESPAVMLFTSGTESLPKGVPLSHKNILSNQRGSLQVVQLYEDDVLLGMLPPFHSFGFTLSGLLPLLSGIRVVYSPDPTDGRRLVNTIKRWKATLICGAPTFLRGIFKQGRKEDLKTLRLCFSGAEKAPEDLFQMIRALGSCSLLEGYGITECSPVISVNMTGDQSKGIGKPIPGVELCIVHLDTHQPLAQGERGLILARGESVFSGYLNPGIASPFITLNGKQWYSTGDLGYLDEEGNLILSGRLKRFIKVGGEMISLPAIEDTLQKRTEHAKDATHEGPALAVCAQEEAGEKTKIFVFTCLSLSLEEANRFLKEGGFSNLVKIHQVIDVPEIPLMGSGKIYYRVLEAKLKEGKS